MSKSVLFPVLALLVLPALALSSPSIAAAHSRHATAHHSSRLAAASTKAGHRMRPGKMPAGMRMNMPMNNNGRAH